MRRRRRRRQRLRDQHWRRWWQAEIVFESGRRWGMRWSRRRYWRRRCWWGWSRWGWGWVEWEGSHRRGVRHRWRRFECHRGRWWGCAYDRASWTFADTEEAYRRHHLDETVVVGGHDGSGEVEDEKNEEGGCSGMFHGGNSGVVKMNKKWELKWIAYKSKTFIKTITFVTLWNKMKESNLGTKKERFSIFIPKFYVMAKEFI